MVYPEPLTSVISRNSLSFKTNTAAININQELSLLTIHWQPQADKADFRKTYQLAVDLAGRFGLTRWLNDSRNLAYLNIQEQNWIYREIVPQMQRSSLQKLARIVIDEPLAILISGNIVDKICNSPNPDCRLQCEIFTNYEHALYWVTS